MTEIVFPVRVVQEPEGEPDAETMLVIHDATGRALDVEEIADAMNAKAFPGEAVKLGKAIAEAAKRDGIYNGDGALDGPVLLLLLSDMADVLEDRHRLTRELDAIVSAPHAPARQASLCDILQPVKQLKFEADCWREGVGGNLVRDGMDGVRLIEEKVRYG